MTTPRRVQVQAWRYKGGKKPEGVVVVSRPGPWGNPFRVEEGRPAGEAVRLFEDYLLARPELVEAARRELRGKDLACYCRPGDPCHADVLLRVANEEPRP